MLSALGEAIKAAEQAAHTADSGHVDLFGSMFDAADVDVYANHRKVRELTLKERLKGEKDTLGLYLTGHPIDEYETEIRRFARQRIVDLKPSRETQTIAGMIIALRVMKNKKGDKMGFVTLDDRSGRIEHRCLPMPSWRHSPCCRPMRWWWWKARSAMTTSPGACACG